MGSCIGKSKICETTEEAGNAKPETKQLISNASVRKSDNEGCPLQQPAAGHLQILNSHQDTDGNIFIQTMCWGRALSTLTQGSHKKCTEYVIKRAVNQNLKTEERYRPICFADERPDLLEILKILLPLSELEYIPGTRWWSPLHCAIVNNNIEAAKLILDYGVDVNTGYKHSNKEFPESRDNMPPLYLSYVSKNMELFRLFLSRGAVLKCQRNIHRVNCYMEEVFICLEDDVNHYIKAMRELVNCGLNLNCNCGIRYLFQRLIYSNVQLHFYKFLLDCGLKPELNCWKRCLCKPVRLTLMSVQSISLAVCYVTNDSLCPSSLKHLKNSSYWPHVKRFIERPAPLQHLCRLAVREILRPKGLHRMKEFVSNMDITDIMKSYLLYEDCLTDLILKEQPQPEAHKCMLFGGFGGLSPPRFCLK